MKNTYFWGMKSVSFNELELLPDRPGIYYVFDYHDRLLYIGKAKSLRDRWRCHEKLEKLLSKGFQRLAYRLVKEHWLLFDEAVDIDRFKPPFNTQQPKPDNHWNWRMRLDVAICNCEFAIKLILVIALVLHLAGSDVPTRLVQNVQRQVELMESRDR